MKITCKELLKELIVFSLATQSHMEQITSVLKYVKAVLRKRSALILYALGIQL